ncbi:hypothetical protein CC99x_004450 [Candidatus Berkiella cookevillensis]|uniref:Uncharacterized protein n=1 Tax=Candidatus Berkiella cookevillensis TaxID=437022 RepID=A0A0Q9YQS6_9GAMM|nr:hypothetical protein [Candidatus Berkiella cookevillensis]MCS5708148.1 hypothetical protein [Candidatus Berkiella cookevillensis]
MRALEIIELDQVSAGADTSAIEPLTIFTTINLSTTLVGATLGGLSSAAQSIASQQPYYMLANIGLGGILGAFLGTTLGVVGVLGYYTFKE